METKYQVIHLYLDDEGVIKAMRPPFLDDDDHHKVGVTGTKVLPSKSLPEDCSWTKLEGKSNDDKS